MAGGNHTMLQMHDVHANYGLVQVLRGVSLHINQGETVALIGPHSSGKTSILKAICGLLPIRKGEILFGEPSIHSLPPEKIVTLGIAYVDEKRLLFPSMSVIDNLILGAYHRNTKDGREKIEQDIDTTYKLFPVLKERSRQLAGTLSGGEQQMLAIGRALMSSPRLLLLDSPTLGLAPKLVNKVRKVISELREQGVSTLLIEQRAQRAINVADRGYIMERGRIVVEGSSQELLSIVEGDEFFVSKIQHGNQA